MSEFEGEFHLICESAGVSSLVFGVTKGQRHTRSNAAPDWRQHLALHSAFPHPRYKVPMKVSNHIFAYL